MKNTFLRSICLTVLCLLCSTTLVSAQTGITWSDPVRMSDPDLGSSGSSIVADAAGVVHLMWSAASTGSNQTDTLFYARWDDASWTTPVDVLVSPGGKGAGWPELAVTPDGTLHAIWVTGGIGYSNLLYSHAPACCANQPQNWSQPVVLDSSALDTAALVADKLGHLHIAFSPYSPGSMVVYMRSDDGGSSWSVHEELDGGVTANDEYTMNPRLAVDDRNRVHAVWTVYPWPGRSVMYARSDDGGETWSSPQVIDSANRDDYREGYGPVFIDVETYSEDLVHLIWDGAPTVERTHVWSSDGGNTWSTRQLLFPEVTNAGRAGWNDMVFDSAGTLHAVSISGGPVLYSSWDGDRWSPSEDISQGIQGPHFLHMTVNLGNQLHATWSNYAVDPGTIWHVWGETPALAVAPTTLPAVQPTVTAAPAATVPTDEIRPTPQPRDADQFDTGQTASATSGVNALLFGAIPALTVVAVVVAVQVRRQRRR